MIRRCNVGSCGTRWRRWSPSTRPGTIRRLPYRWAEDDAWKDLVMRPDPGGSGGDDRIERHPDPQYQYEEDRLTAEAAFERDGCPTCVFLA